MMNRRLKKASAVLLAMTMIFSLAGCVDQSQGKKSSDSATQTESSTDETASSKTADKKTSDSKSDKDSSNEDAKSLLEINDPEEKAAVEAAKKKVQAIQGSSQHLRLLQIFVTSWILILSVYQRAVFPKFHQDTKR